MLNNISWASYFYAISILAFIYYALLLVLYFRQDLRNRLQKLNGGFNTSSLSRKLSFAQNGTASTEDFSVEKNQLNSVHELLLSLQTLIKTGAFKNFPKEELLLSLQLKLRDHPALQDANLKDSISNFILNACENYCSIHLSEEEVSALWIK